MAGTAAPAPARDRRGGSAFSAEAGAAGGAGGRACGPAGLRASVGVRPGSLLHTFLRLPAPPGPQEVGSEQNRPRI